MNTMIQLNNINDLKNLGIGNRVEMDFSASTSGDALSGEWTVIRVNHESIPTLSIARRTENGGIEFYWGPISGEDYVVRDGKICNISGTLHACSPISEENNRYTQLNEIL
tara:strand:+ start:357 stop:686 length:330 start_codon:yes stop_codon:yes gene_type:complete